MTTHRIERIGRGVATASDAVTATVAMDASGPGTASRAGSAERVSWHSDLPGVRRLEWHAASTPDGEFVRLPVPGLVIILNVGTRGEWRLDARAGWSAQPAVSVRGLALQPTVGRDPMCGALAYVSIVLAPWAAALYLGAPVAAFPRGLTDLSLVDPAWSALAERLALASTNDQRRALVEHALRRRMRSLDDAVRAARARVLQLEQGTCVGAVAAAHGISARRLHQWTTATLGIAPHALGTLARFGRGIELLHAPATASERAQWYAEHADQSHAIRAFRRLAGVTPGQYHAYARLGRRTRFVVPAVPGGAPNAV